MNNPLVTTIIENKIKISSMKITQRPDDRPNLAAPLTPLASPYLGFKNTPSYSLPVTYFATCE